MISDFERKSVQDFTYHAGEKFGQHVIIGPTFFTKGRSRIRHVVGFEGNAFNGFNSTLAKQWYFDSRWQTVEFTSHGPSGRQARLPFTDLVHPNAIAVLRDTTVAFVQENDLRWSHSKPGEIDIRDYMRAFSRDIPAVYDPSRQNAYMRDWLQRDLLNEGLQPVGRRMTPAATPARALGDAGKAPPAPQLFTEWWERERPAPQPAREEVLVV